MSEEAKAMAILTTIASSGLKLIRLLSLFFSEAKKALVSYDPPENKWLLIAKNENFLS